MLRKNRVEWFGGDVVHVYWYESLDERTLRQLQAALELVEGVEDVWMRRYSAQLTFAAHVRVLLQPEESVLAVLRSYNLLAAV